MSFLRECEILHVVTDVVKAARIVKFREYRKRKYLDRKRSSLHRSQTFTRLTQQLQSSFSAACLSVTYADGLKAREKRMGLCRPSMSI